MGQIVMSGSGTPEQQRDQRESLTQRFNAMRGKVVARTVMRDFADAMGGGRTPNSVWASTHRIAPPRPASLSCAASPMRRP